MRGDCWLTEACVPRTGPTCERAERTRRGGGHHPCLLGTSTTPAITRPCAGGSGPASGGCASGYCRGRRSGDLRSDPTRRARRDTHVMRLGPAVVTGNEPSLRQSDLPLTSRAVAPPLGELVPALLLQVTLDGFVHRPASAFRSAGQPRPPRWQQRVITRLSRPNSRYSRPARGLPRQSSVRSCASMRANRVRLPLAPDKQGRPGGVGDCRVVPVYRARGAA